MKSHRKEWKRKQVEELTQLFGKYSVVGIADLSGAPASLVQKLRKNLHGKAELRVSKTRIIKKALEAVSDKKMVLGAVSKSCVMIFSELDPFELFAFLKKSRAKGFARAGYVAEDDIVIPAGDTGLPPGPALSDLKAAGLQIKIQGPTIQVVADKVVARKGEAVTPPIATVLAKLDIKPVKVGLKVVSFYRDKVFFAPEVLDIDSEKVFNGFAAAYTAAVNLSFNAGIFNGASVPLLVGKAFKEARAVALAAGASEAQSQ